MSDADADEEELLARMRERMDTERSGDLMEVHHGGPSRSSIMEDLDAAAAEGAGRDPLLKSPQKKNVASAHGDFAIFANHSHTIWNRHSDSDMITAAMTYTMDPPTKKPRGGCPAERGAPAVPAGRSRR